MAVSGVGVFVALTRFSFLFSCAFRPWMIRCSMYVLRFSLPRVFSISRKSFCSMVMLMLCFMAVDSLRLVYLVY